MYTYKLLAKILGKSRVGAIWLLSILTESIDFKVQKF